MKTTELKVYAGIDTHADTNHVAVISELGRKLGDAQFPTTRSGYEELHRFILSFGKTLRVGIEGTASYGAGVTAYLRSHAVMVREVIRPKRQARRNGKSDPIDAYAAARTMASDEDLPIPKILGGPIDGIRALLRTRRTALKARTAAIVQVKSLLITAPAALREIHSGQSTDDLITALAHSLPADTDYTQCALRRLAERVRFLDEEIIDADEQLAPAVEQVAPALVQAKAVGTVTAAQLLVTAGENPERIKSKAAFAALCGVSPIQASSGKTNRHRLNRGGDRQANAALHRVVLVRMGSDSRTKDYVAKATAQGKAKKEIMRCLKRYVANEIFGLITHPEEVPGIEDLRPLRKSCELTLENAAQAFGVWPMKISTIERGKRRDDEFAQKYRHFLLNAA